MSDSDQLKALSKLIRDAKALDLAVAVYLDQWASARISHRHGDFLDVLRRERAALEAQAQRELARAANASDRATRMTYDQHTLDSAKRLNITPDEFLALQEERRREMRAKAAT